MHLLLFYQYFPPEMGAPAARAYEFTRRWVRAGHRVSVICGIPNHPTGEIYPGYDASALLHERIEGVDVYRTWVYVTPNAGTARRSLNYISYGVSAVLAAGRIRDADVCIATTPQFFAGIAGALFARLARIPFILDVRDLWPDSIEAVEAGTGAAVIRVLRRIERIMYRSADRIVVVSPAFQPHIVACGIPASTIDVITNGVDPELFVRGPAPRRRFTGELADAFIVLYAGTHGMAHGLDTVLEAAERLAHDTRIRFVFVGEGAEKARLRRAAAGRPNVHFFDRVPRATVAGMTAEADVCLVPLRNTPLFRTVIPSKMFEIMAAGRPMILGVEGQARALLEEADAGLPVPPEDAAALAAAILRLRDEPALAARFGENACRFVCEKYHLDALASRYLEVAASLSPPRSR